MAERHEFLCYRYAASSFFFSKQICKFLRALALVLLPRGGGGFPNTCWRPTPREDSAAGENGAAFRCRDILAGPSSGTAKRRLWRLRDEELGTGPALLGGQRLQRGGEHPPPAFLRPSGPGQLSTAHLREIAPGPQVGEGGRRAGAQRGEPRTSPRRPRGCAAALPAPLPRSERGGPLAGEAGKLWVSAGRGVWGCGGASLGNAGKHHQEMQGVTGGCGSAGQRVPQLRGCGRGCVRVFLCVCVCACVFVCVCCVRAACPLPRPPCQKGVGDFPASRPLKTALPGGGFVAPGGGRLAASALRRGEWAEGRAAAAAPRGRAALGCGSRRGRSLARLDGRFCRLPRAPGSFASRALSHPSFRIALQ